MGVNLDQDLENADWVKQTWDIPARNTEDLLAYLEVSGIPVEQFMMLPAAQAIPWIASDEEVRYDDVVPDDLQGGPA